MSINAQQTQTDAKPHLSNWKSFFNAARLNEDLSSEELQEIKNILSDAYLILIGNLARHAESYLDLPGKRTVSILLPHQKAERIKSDLTNDILGSLPPDKGDRLLEDVIFWRQLDQSMFYFGEHPVAFSFEFSNDSEASWMTVVRFGPSDNLVLSGNISKDGMETLFGPLL